MDNSLCDSIYLRAGFSPNNIVIKKKNMKHFPH